MANLTFLYWIIGFLGVGFTALMGVAIYHIVRKDEGDKTLLENFMPQYAEGCTDGFVKNMELGEDTIGIEFEDIHNRNNVYKLFYSKHQVDVYPKGSFSNKYHKIKAYPDDITLLPLGLKDHREIKERIEENQREKDNERLLKMRIENLSSIAEKTFGGKIYTEFVRKAQEQIRDLERNWERGQIQPQGEKPSDKK